MAVKASTAQFRAGVNWVQASRRLAPFSPSLRLCPPPRPWPSLCSGVSWGCGPSGRGAVARAGQEAEAPGLARRAPGTLGFRRGQRGRQGTGSARRKAQHQHSPARGLFVLHERNSIRHSRPVRSAPDSIGAGGRCCSEEERLLIHPPWWSSYSVPPPRSTADCAL